MTTMQPTRTETAAPDVLEDGTKPAPPMPTPPEVPDRAVSEASPASLLKRIGHFGRLSATPAAIFIASRIGALLVASAISYDTRIGIRKVLIKWDAGWYVQVARQGYPHVIPQGQSTIGFFPLLPGIIRIFEEATPLTFNQAGLLVAFLGGLLSAVAVWWLIKDYAGEVGATQGTALVVLAPAAFIFSQVYAESILIGLAALALLALRRRRWLLAGIAAGVATASSPLAGALVLACAVTAIVAIKKRREWRALIAPILAPAGIVAFFAFLWVRTGTPLAWFESERRPGWQSGHFGYAIFHEIDGIAHTGYKWPNNWVPIASLAVVLVLLVFFAWGRPSVPVATFAGGVLALAFVSPVTGISPRVMLNAFPLVAFVGARLPRKWFVALLGVSALSMAALEMLTLGSFGYTP
jgi:hypothetical protein